MDNLKPLVALRGLERGNMFYTTNSPGEDITLTADGKVSYEVLGYADTDDEARVILRANGWPY
jgi:hypothetical protein